MNEMSSRSHALFTVTIECSYGHEAGASIRQGKLHLVDLAVRSKDIGYEMNVTLFRVVKDSQKLEQQGNV